MARSAVGRVTRPQIPPGLFVVASALIALGGVLLGTSPGLTQTRDPGLARKAFDRGAELEAQAAVLLSAGDKRDAAERLSDAVEAYRQAHKADPGDVDSAVRIGHVLLHLGRGSEAVAELTAAAHKAFRINVERDFSKGHPGPSSASPKLIELASLLGRCRLAQGPDEVGLAIVEWVLRRRSTDAQLHYVAGRGYLAQRRHVDALRHLSAYLESHPKDAKVLAAVGNLHLHLGDLKQATSAYERVLELQPGATGALRNLAVAKFRQGDHAEAIRVYRALLKRRPNDAVSRYNLGISLAITHDHEGAAQELRAALAVDATLPQGWQRLGESLERIGQPDNAVKAFERAAANQGDALTAWLAIARVRRAQGHVEAVVETLRRALGISPRNPEILLALGDGLRELGRAQEALDAHRKGAEVAGKDARMHVALGADHVALGDHDAAIIAYRRAREIAPDSEAARLGVAESLFQVGARRLRARSIAPAIEYLQEAADLRRRDALVRTHLGIAHLADGHPATARPVLEQALEIDPEQNRARLALAQVWLALGKPDEARVLVRTPLPDASPEQTLYRQQLYGVALTETGSAGRAVPLLRQVAQGQGSRIGPRYNLARALTLSGRHEKAKRQLDLLPGVIPGLDPAGRPALSAARGYVSLRRGDAAAAIRQLDHACGSRDAPRIWRTILATAQIQRGLDLEAQRDLTQAISLFSAAAENGGGPVAEANVAALRYRLGQIDAAVPAIERLARQGTPAVALHNLAIYYDDIADDDTQAYRWYALYHQAGADERRNTVANLLERKRALFGLGR